MNKEFWKTYSLPIQDEFIDVDSVNVADAFRKQADAINMSGPIYAELEVLETRLERVLRIEKELKQKVLAQNMPVHSASTRTNDLVDAFTLKCSETYEMADGSTKDISDMLVSLSRRRSKLEIRITHLQRRLKAIETMADRCSEIINYWKFTTRLESGGRL
jgi:chromosome segregation ATPase